MTLKTVFSLGTDSLSDCGRQVISDELSSEDSNSSVCERGTIDVFDPCNLIYGHGNNKTLSLESVNVNMKTGWTH